MTESEKLEQRILEEAKRFPEVSFAKLSRIAKHFYDFGKQAGTKWMAGQGVTIEGFITGCDDHISFDSEDYLPEGSPFEDMERVIIQVRKKED